MGAYVPVWKRDPWGLATQSLVMSRRDDPVQESAPGGKHRPASDAALISTNDGFSPTTKGRAMVVCTVSHHLRFSGVNVD